MENKNTIRVNKNNFSFLTKSKKAVSPILATILIIVLTTFAVVQLSSFVTETQDDLQANANTDNIFKKPKIETISEDTIYFNNNQKTNITLNAIKIGATECTLASSVILKANSITTIDNLSNCFSQVNGKQKIVFETNKGLFFKTHAFTN